MQQEITNNQLLALQRDIERCTNESAAFYFFNKEKIKRFYQQNTFLLNIINKNMDAAVKKYVVYGEDDKPKTEEKDGQTVYVFASEDDEKQYIETTQEFLSRTVKVQL